MNKALLVLLVAFALWGVCGCAGSNADISKEVVRLERQALDGWRTGNPEPFLAMADPRITYFHVMTNGRLDGRAAVQALFEPYRGTPLFDRYEMLDPKVQPGGNWAVLSYILVQHNGASTARWNRGSAPARPPSPRRSEPNRRP